jgi:hypothetical protein
MKWRVHVLTKLYIHAYMHPYTHIHAHTQTARWYEMARTCYDKAIHTCIYTHTHAYIHTYRRLDGMKWRVHAMTKPYIHASIHTYIHTYRRLDAMKWLVHAMTKPYVQKAPLLWHTSILERYACVCRVCGLRCMHVDMHVHSYKKHLRYAYFNLETVCMCISRM